MEDGTKEIVDQLPASAGPFWCSVCDLDLQSRKSLAEHQNGRKHVKRLQRKHPGAAGAQKCLSRNFLPPIDEEELFRGLANGDYKNVVVLTGAGVSTAAGLPDFRSPGGLFDIIRNKFGMRFPEVQDEPEYILSRRFADSYPDIYNDEVLPMTKSYHAEGVEPTSTHKFCAWLHHQGVLRRVYTQNIDGLHVDPSLKIPEDIVCECHGAARNGSIVLYGDPIPQRFHDCCARDFDRGQVDLILVFGSALQVAPFCGVPNLAPRGCVRVLVNRDLGDCIRNQFSRSAVGYYGMVSTDHARIGKRKDVPLRPLWTDQKGNKKWRQLLIEGDCDDFVESFFCSPAAVLKAISTTRTGPQIK